MMQPAPPARIMRGMLIAILAVGILVYGLDAPMRAAAPDFNVAGLVVDYGDGRVSYAWVPFDEDKITGLDLLRRSGLDLVTVSFGGMGEGVCQIDVTGCPVDDCRRRLCQNSDPESPFWRYSQQGDPGAWSFANAGASATTVRDGDINAWVWSGVDVELPALTMDDIAGRAGVDLAAVDRMISLPEPVVRTEGGESHNADDDGVPAGAISGAVAVVAVGAVAAFAILRAKRAQGAA